MKKASKTVKMSAIDAIESGASILEELTEEMTNWRDNMPDNLQESDRGQRVSEAADTLEDCDVRSPLDTFTSTLQERSEGAPFRAGCPEHVEGKPCPRCKWNGVPREGGRIPAQLEDTPAVEPIPELAALLNLQVEVTESTKKRMSRADRLAEACHYIEVGRESLKEALENLDTEQDIVQEMLDLLTEIEDGHSAVQDVEFPGMFG